MEIVKEYIEYRLNLCKKCKLYSPKAGGYCNDRMWYNPETNKTSVIKKHGFIKGCGCVLENKIKNIKSVCPIGKW